MFKQAVNDLEITLTGNPPVVDTIVRLDLDSSAAPLQPIATKIASKVTR